MENDEIEVAVDTQQNEETDMPIGDQLLAREILACGINTNDSVYHFGSGYNNSVLFRYLQLLKQQGAIATLGLNYVSIDPDERKQANLQELYAIDSLGIDLKQELVPMQEFLDSTDVEADWCVITGIFDDVLYDDMQYQFLDKMITSALKLSREGVVFTFDTSSQTEMYNINLIISYVNATYLRYRVSRLNEKNYVLCVNKYY